MMKLNRICFLPCVTRWENWEDIKLGEITPVWPVCDKIPEKL